MNKEKKLKLNRSQVSRKLERIDISQFFGISSWSRYIRSALGMSGTQLASRLNVSQSSVSELERREAEGSISIKKLRQMANAMDCELVYAMVPRSSIDETVHNQATKKALESMKLTDTHMSLEDQKVQTNNKERLEFLVDEKLYSKYLWDENE